MTYSISEKLLCVGALRGGKGGFGSMLRSIGAQIERTTNHEVLNFGLSVKIITSQLVTSLKDIYIVQVLGCLNFLSRPQTVCNYDCFWLILPI